MRVWDHEGFVLLIDVRMDSFVYKMSKYLEMLMFYLTNSPKHRGIWLIIKEDRKKEKLGAEFVIKSSQLFVPQRSLRFPVNKE